MKRNRPRGCQKGCQRGRLRNRPVLLKAFRILAFTLPLKTTEADLEQISTYLANQVGWVPLSKIRAAIPPKHADNRKVEAVRYLGLIERDGENIKLTPTGRDYAAGDAAKRGSVMRQLLQAKPLYKATLDWMHYQGKTAPNKTEIANYWHDHHSGETAGATNEAMTSSAVFFMRMVGVAELGKFIAAGHGRDTHLETDTSKLEEFATGAPPPEPAGKAVAQPPTAQPVPAPAPPPSAGVLVGTGLNVNLEIHIAADAKPATVEEIFKNMRKYLIDGPESSADRG